MIPYLLTWVLLALNALGGARRWGQTTLAALLVFFTLLIGLRNEVGGDWLNYLSYVNRQQGAPFYDAILGSDEIAYDIINWLGANWLGGVFLVNTVCALIFTLGLLLLCRAQPRPWLALILAFPYLVTVVAMGYTRQAVAIGFECLALLALERDRLLVFLFWISLAVLFHKTALVLMVLPALTLNLNLRFSQIIRLAMLAMAGFGLLSSLLLPKLDNYQINYLYAEYQSQGALIRVLLCLIPALVFLTARRRFSLTPQLMRIWTILSFGAILAAISLATISSSTVVDRLALYLLPLQLFVGSRLPDTCLLRISPGTWNLLLISLTLAVLLVWLLFAVNSFAWLPYRNVLLPF